MRHLLDQLASINWAITLLSGLVLSIVGNLLNYPMQNWLARRSVERARRRVQQLEEQLRDLETLTRSPFDLGMKLTASGLKVVIWFALATAITTLTDVFPERLMPDASYRFILGVGTLLYLVSMLLAVDMLKTVTRIRDFKTYRERVEHSIADLKTTSR